MYLNLFHWVWMYLNVFECVSVCFTEFKYIWMCENANLLLGCPPRWVARNSCCRICLLGAKSFSISINLFSFLPMVFIWNKHSRLFYFVKGPLISSLFASSWLFQKETAVKMWQDLQTHLKSCLPSSLTSILRPILSWMLMPVISSFTKMQMFQKCQ